MGALAIFRMNRLRVFIAFAIATFVLNVNTFIYVHGVIGNLRNFGEIRNAYSSGGSVLLTIHIAANSRPALLSKLLESIVLQRTTFVFEIAITDLACLPETKRIIEQILRSGTRKHKYIYKYLDVCESHGYAYGHNRGVQSLSATSSKWVLFLNDNISIKPNFLQNMYNLGEGRDSVAVGCKVLSTDGGALNDAGSIVWNEGSCARYGRGRSDMNASEFMYARPVDFVSEACLMMRRDEFVNYGGFDIESFSKNYEYMDLQMHLQHDLGGQVWFQPLAVAKYSEHVSFESPSCVEFTETGMNKFRKKWRKALTTHLPPPLKNEDEVKQLLFASDIRSRLPEMANILYIDDRVPNKKNGAGYGRSLDNLMMIASLGHRLTVTSLEESDRWCDKHCRKQIQQRGIELVSQTQMSVSELLESRAGFYNIVLISRPSTFGAIHNDIRSAFLKQPSFCIIYDCEALWYRRDEKLSLKIRNGAYFPGAVEKGVTDPFWTLVSKVERDNELAWLRMADVIVTVSDTERNYITKTMKPFQPTGFTVGHTMEPETLGEKSFMERKGVLFLGAFHGSMYYNGDAVWYFLKHIYPMVLEAAPDIPLTIAGRGIPQELLDIVSNNTELRKHVSFLESPKGLRKLYDNARVFVAPHQYGAGIQYKISEAFSLGLPVVLSEDSAVNFGLTTQHGVGCIGSDPEAFKACVVSVHEHESLWRLLRAKGLEFIRTTHDRVKLTGQWALVIRSAIDRLEERKECRDRCAEHGIVKTKLIRPDHPCSEGENFYFTAYSDVKEAVEKSFFSSAFAHWKTFGAKEGRIYACYSSQAADQVTKEFRDQENLD